MINIPGSPVIGGDSNPGIWTPDSVLIGSQQSKPFYSIDMTAATLDSRITYTGPEYITFGSSSAFDFAAGNTWAVEYRNGVPAGRIELMPASANIVTSNTTTGVSSVQHSSGWTDYRETTTDNSAAFVAHFDVFDTVTAQFVFRHVGRPNLALRVSTGGVGEFSQIGINNGVIGYQSPNFISAEIVSITDEIKIIAATFVATAAEANGSAEAWFCSSDHEVVNDELPSYAGDTTKGFDLFFDGQVENSSISTSQLEFNTSRTAQSAVIDTSDAKSITLVYTSGSKTYKTPDDTFTLPTATRNWQRRLIKRIDFR